MRLTRHAKNRGRRLKISAADAALIVDNPTHVDYDETGKPRYTAKLRGKRVCVVVAVDEPDLVVTIFLRRPQ